MELNQKWGQLMMKHGVGIHMRELVGLRKPYEGWDIPKRDAVLAEFIDVIRDVRMTGVGVVVEVAAFRQLKKDHPEFDLHTVQEFSLERVLRRTVDRLDEIGLGEPVALVFDTDPEFSKRRIDLFHGVLEHDKRARLASMTFARAEVYPGLQCADILAWETRKQQIQKAGGYKSTARWAALFAEMPDYELDYMGELWDEEELEKIVPQLAELTERRKAVLSEARQP
jgi:hypothetical protein